jgi:hypothetical protein
MDLTLEKKTQVHSIAWTLTQREIAVQREVRLGAVNNINKLTNEAGSIPPQRKEWYERRRKTTFIDVVVLLRQSKIDPCKIGFDLQNDLAAAVVQVHDSTVRRRLLEVGRKANKPTKK